MAIAFIALTLKASTFALDMSCHSMTLTLSIQIARPFPGFFQFANTRSRCKEPDKRAVVETYHNKALVYSHSTVLV